MGEMDEKWSALGWKRWIKTGLFKAGEVVVL
jgi:hypothetical protein